MKEDRSVKLEAAHAWAVAYYEGWNGPKAKWTKRQRDHFDAQMGFLMLFIDGFKFSPKEQEGAGV